MIRLGLCCTFQDQPIKFVNTTAAFGRLKRPEALAKLARLCAANAGALLASLRFCAGHGIGCFRINSQILPLKTHPQHGYDVADLPGADEIIRRFGECGTFAKGHRLRTSFHPDQFVVLNSPRREVVGASVREIEYQAEVAGWVGADVVNVHGGGAFGDKARALDDFARNLARLSPGARTRLTVENDDRIYTPADLLPLCRAEGVPPLVRALVGLKTAINDANREAQRDIYDLAEKKGAVQFLAGLNTRHGPQPAVYPNTTEVRYVAALTKADVDARVAELEKEIDRLQDRLDQFNHERKVEVDGRTLELAS